MKPNTHTIKSSDIALTLGVTVQAVNKRATKENWPAQVLNRRGDRRFVVSDLPEDVRVAIAAGSRSNEVAAVGGRRSVVTAPQGAMDKGMAKADLLRLYTQAMRRARHGQKAGARKAFVAAYNSGLMLPELFAQLGQVKWQTIEGWKRAVKEGGDTMVLSDRRGYHRRGQTLITDDQAEIILACVLHPNRPLVSEAVRMAKTIMAQKGIPNGYSESTYRRWLETWKEENHHIWVFSRQGAKAWNDQCAMYVERDYNLIQVGDIMVADGHVLNFEIINPWTGKPKRMTLIVWLDMKSTYPCGWEIMPTENTGSIAAALRRAIITLGKAPQVAYLDNGRAFASRFFNGADLEQAGFSGLFERLGMKTIFAWPYHGQSKTVERFFGSFAELERWSPTYSGTSIEKKPPRMMRGERQHRALYNKVVGENYLTMAQAHRAIATWFDVYAKRPQRGHLNGACPLEIFAEGRGPGVDAVDLRYLMLAQEIRTIGRNGISLFGQNYFHPALYGRRHGVTVRYDLQNLSSVVIEYRGELLCEAPATEKVHPAASILGTDADRKRLSEQIEEKRRQEKLASVTARTILENDVMPSHQRQLELAGVTETGAPTATAAPVRHLPAPKPADEARILAEADAMAVDSDAAARRRALEGMGEADRYEALMEMEARGEMVPEQWARFMAYFEQTQAYLSQADYYEERRAIFATMYQVEDRNLKAEV